MSRLRAALWGVSGFTVGYLAPGTLRLPTLAYDPVTRIVQLTQTPSGVQMRYFSDVLTACIVGLLAALVGARLPAKMSDERIPVAATLSIVALAVAFHLSRLLGPG